MHIRLLSIFLLLTRTCTKTFVSPIRALSVQVNEAIDDLNTQSDLLLPQREAEELFLLPDGAVQIFFVRKDGNVSTFSAPSALRIFRFKDLQPGEETSPTFIQVKAKISERGTRRKLIFCWH